MWSVVLTVAGEILSAPFFETQPHSGLARTFALCTICIEGMVLRQMCHKTMGDCFGPQQPIVPTVSLGGGGGGHAGHFAASLRCPSVGSVGLEAAQPCPDFCFPIPNDWPESVEPPAPMSAKRVHKPRRKMSLRSEPRFWLCKGPLG